MRVVKMSIPKFLWSFPARSQGQPSEPRNLTDPVRGEPTGIVVAIDSSNSKITQIDYVIEAACQAVSAELPQDFPYVERAKYGSGLEAYTKSAKIFTKRGGEVMAQVDFDEQDGLILLTLDGAAAKHYRDLRTVLNRKYTNPEFLYGAEPLSLRRK